MYYCHIQLITVHMQTWIENIHFKYIPNIFWVLVASCIIHFTVVIYLISINIFKYPDVTSRIGLYKHIDIFKLMSDLVK